QRVLTRFLSQASNSFDARGCRGAIHECVTTNTRIARARPIRVFVILFANGCSGLTPTVNMYVTLFDTFCFIFVHPRLTPAPTAFARARPSRMHRSGPCALDR